MMPIVNRPKSHISVANISRVFYSDRGWRWYPGKSFGRRAHRPGSVHFRGHPRQWAIYRPISFLLLLVWLGSANFRSSPRSYHTWRRFRPGMSIVSIE